MCLAAGNEILVQSENCVPTIRSIKPVVPQKRPIFEKMQRLCVSIGPENSKSCPIDNRKPHLNPLLAGHSSPYNQFFCKFQERHARKALQAVSFLLR